MDKKQSDLLKEQVKLRDHENKIKEEAEAVGINITTDSGGIVTDLIDETSRPEVDHIPILSETKYGKYRVDEQHFAIMFLEVFQREDKATGDMIPRYTDVSKMLGIPKGTLQGWWKKKEDLQTQQSTLMSQGFKYISTSLMVEMIRMLQALSKVNYGEMVEDSKDMKNFISLMNTMMNKVRLFSGQSTQNVAHKHAVAMVVPDEE